jgi:hypothetical protein
MCTQQVWKQDVRVKDPNDSTMSGLIGFGGRINPADFPEMTHFEIVVSESR